MIPDARPRRHRRPLDRAGRGRARRVAARGEALDPRPRRAHRGLLPRRRSRARRPVRLVAPVTDEDAGRRRVVRRQPGALERLDRRPRRRRLLRPRGSRRAASGSGRTRSSCSATSTGKSLLHLQCHFGIDTLSWARLGARVTGADLSPAAIELARMLAVDWVPRRPLRRSNLYDLPEALDGTFDIVYTSRGVLGWLPTSGPGHGSSPTSWHPAARSSSPRPTRSSTSSRTRASRPASSA